MRTWPHHRRVHGPRTGTAPGQRGAIRLSMLRVLAERPMHGYELITDLEDRTGGRWRPSPGAIYPALAQLEDEGLDHGHRRRRQASIRADRRRPTWLDEHHDDEQTTALGTRVSRHGDLRRLGRRDRRPARQLGRFGTPAQPTGEDIMGAHPRRALRGPGRTAARTEACLTTLTPVSGRR